MQRTSIKNFVLEFKVFAIHHIFHYLFDTQKYTHLHGKNNKKLLSPIYEWQL